MGHRSAPEMPECIFRATHDTCKPVLIQTPSLPLVSFLRLSLSLVFSHSTCILDSEQDQHLRGKKTNKTKSEREQKPGAEAGMRQVFCVFKCAHVCGVHCASRLSAPSMRPLLLGVVVVGGVTGPARLHGSVLSCCC